MSLSSVLRSLAHRAGLSAVILVVALVASAAAATGPTYYSASKDSILGDTLAGAPVSGRGVEVVQSGGLNQRVEPLMSQVQNRLSGDLASLGGAGAERRLFRPPVEALEATAFLPSSSEDIPLVWRSDVCAHLAIRGACPTRPDQIMISSSLATINSWHLGQRLTFPNWGSLTVTGVYTPPAVTGDYWYDRASTYFPYEQPASLSINVPAYDAMFVPRATIENAASPPQGDAVVSFLLDNSHVGQGDAGALSAAVTDLVDNTVLNAQQAVVTSEIPHTVDLMQSGWTSLALPVVLITAELLVLSSLLLFLVVHDAVDARGPEIALAKLRGQGRWRTALFGLSEPVLLIAVALPLGVLSGWGTAAVLAGMRLRTGTQVALPGVGWAAAGVATLGGLAAVVAAARNTLTRSVVDQWRRTGRRATDRGWVIDAVLLAAAAAGLVELVVTDQVAPSTHQVLSLLVPGLLGLAVAVVASRLLPLLCRIAAIRTQRLGGLALFLALRQVARRPGAVRITILLATSFSLATFAISAWLVVQSNDRLIAGAQVGAPTVLTVSVPNDQDLGSIVNRVDPAGKQAVAVERSSNGQATTLAVDPARYARVATWPNSFSPTPLALLAASLDPPAPPPVALTGDAVRVALSLSSPIPAGVDLATDVGTRAGPATVDFGPLPRSGHVTVTGALGGCPCTLGDFTLNLPPGATPLTGTITFAAVQVHGPPGWSPIDAGFSHASRWRAKVAGSNDTLVAGPAGLSWRFTATGRPPTATLVSVNHPTVLPAIASSALTGGHRGAYSGAGFGGRGLAVSIVAPVVAVPGAPADGIIVDRRYAELAAGGSLSAVTQQVWLAAGAERVVRPKLTVAGVRILSTQHVGDVSAMLGREGPALATVLFLADAIAAALLASGGAIAGLYLYSRRRGYEYAALAATGLTRRTLLGSLVIEQLLSLAFGMVVGIGVGLGAVALALRSVPEFLTLPVAPPLSYTPDAGPLALILGVFVVVLLLSAVGASVTLVRAVRLDQLREAPP